MEYDSECPIRSAQDMMAVIEEIGIIPFSKNRVRGWSIEELTHPDWWPFTSGELGVWDWKVDAVREGFFYGKFIARKAAFATNQMYRHLMNWRRSLPQYVVAEGGRGAVDGRMAEGGRGAVGSRLAEGGRGAVGSRGRAADGGRGKADSIDARLQKHLSPVLLSAIREHGTLDTSEIRILLEQELPMELRKKVGGHIEKYLIPKITKQAVDFLLGFLDMGTWTVVGDITRVSRGPDNEYKGWQRNSITTPDALLGADGNYLNGRCGSNKVNDGDGWGSGNVDGCGGGYGSWDGENGRGGGKSEVPYWARFLEDDSQTVLMPDCSPEESRQFILEHLTKLFPEGVKAFGQYI